MYTRREFGQTEPRPPSRCRAPWPAAESTRRWAASASACRPTASASCRGRRAATRWTCIIKAMTECGLGECELWRRSRAAARPSSPARPARARLARSPEGARRAPRLAARDAARSLRARSRRSSTRPASASSPTTTPSTRASPTRRSTAASRWRRPSARRSSPPRPRWRWPRRVVPFAEKHKMVVAMHGHSKRRRPERVRHARELRRGDEDVEVLQGQPRHRPLHGRQLRRRGLHREHHADITNLHLKDRKKNQGDNTPWGEGDTPIREVLQLLKTRHAGRSPPFIEYEYRGAGTPVEEVKKCFAYARQALA